MEVVNVKQFEIPSSITDIKLVVDKTEIKDEEIATYFKVMKTNLLDLQYLDQKKLEDLLSMLDGKVNLLVTYDGVDKTVAILAYLLKAGKEKEIYKDKYGYNPYYAMLDDILAWELEILNKKYAIKFTVKAETGYELQERIEFLGKLDSVAYRFFRQ